MRARYPGKEVGSNDSNHPIVSPRMLKDFEPLPRQVLLVKSWCYFLRPQKIPPACGVFWGLQFVAGAARGRGIHGTRASRGSNGGETCGEQGFLEWPSGKCTKSPWLFVFFFTGGKFLLKDLRFQSHQMVVRFFKLLGSRNTFSFSHTDACSRNTRSRSCGSGCSRNRC